MDDVRSRNALPIAQTVDLFHAFSGPKTFSSSLEYSRFQPRWFLVDSTDRLSNDSRKIYEVVIMDC